MALIVEDGSGMVDADSYVSVADCTDYHAAMGNTAWASLDEPAQEAMLRRATQYIDVRYTFRGQRLRSTQALAWPRDIAPWPISAVVTATCEAALRADSGLFRDQDGGEVISETVGKISVTYAQGGLGGQARFALIDSLLSPYTAGGSMSTIRLERA